jgi:hypothetical protein
VRGLCGYRVNLARESAENELLQIDLLARVVDVDPNQAPRAIVVQHEAFETARLSTLGFSERSKESVSAKD